MQIIETISHILLWLLVIVEGIFILALARQIGILHERIGSTGARTINAGPKIGELAPALDIQDINNQTVVLGNKHGMLTLLLFVSPGCSTCAALLPQVKRLARDEKDTLKVVLLSFATSLEASQKYVKEHKLDKSIPFVVSDDLALSYQVTLAPYGIVIDRQGIVRAKGIVNNYSHIESLLNAEELGVRSLEEYTQRREIIREGPIQN